MKTRQPLKKVVDYDLRRIDGRGNEGTEDDVRDDKAHGHGGKMFPKYSQKRRSDT
jgi:hypothetical protein